MNIDQMDYLVLGLTIVITLVLLGAVAFGAGAEFVASKGLGVGAWGALRVGGEGCTGGRSEQLTRLEGCAGSPGGCCGKATEGCCGEGVIGGPRKVGDVQATGVWDTAGGQMGMSGRSLTTVGFEEEKWHGAKKFGSI